MDTEKIEKKIEKRNASKSSKTKSPPKRNARGRPARRQRYVDSDLDVTDSDSDTPISQMLSRASRPSPRRPSRPAHDPNTIVLDCDDEFIGGPAVAFSRNLANAEAISAEDSKSLKVHVKINNKIEQYEMNPVSYEPYSLTSIISPKRTIINSLVPFFC